MRTILYTCDYPDCKETTQWHGDNFIEVIYAIPDNWVWFGRGPASRPWRVICPNHDVLLRRGDPEYLSGNAEWVIVEKAKK